MTTAIAYPAVHYPGCNDKCVGDSHWFDGNPTLTRIEAVNELAQLIHDWSVKYVDGHIERDRYSCASVGLAQNLADGMSIGGRLE